MRCSPIHPFRCLVLCLSLILVCVPARAQKAQTPQKPINLDRELEEPASPDRAASYYHYSLSKWYEDNNDLPKALAEMQTALRFNPNSSAVHLELAALLEKMRGNTQEVLDNAEEAARLDPQDPDPHWFLAKVYFRNASGGVAKAIQELEKLKQLTPEDERVYYAMGGAYFEQNKPEKAIEAYEKFQSLTTSGDSGYREIAKYYDRTGNEEKAVEYLNKGLKVDPDSTETLGLLALLYSKQNKAKDVIPIYKKLLEVMGSNTNISRDLAVALLETNQHGDALKILDELAKNQDLASDPGIMAARGKALFGLRKFTDALQLFQSVVDADPGALEARFYLGRVYEETARYSEAARVFSYLLEKATGEEARNNRTVFQQHLAADYMEMGNHEKAIGVYQEMAKADPKRANPNLLNAYRISKQFDKALPLGKDLYDKDRGDLEIGVLYARTLSDAGKGKEGAEILNKLVQSNPDNIGLYVNLGQVYLLDRRFSDAEKILRLAESRSPDNIDIYVNLSQVYIQDKRYADAEKILKLAENKSPDKENNDRLKIRLASVYEKQNDFDRAESIAKEILKGNPQNAEALNYIGYMLADRGIRLEEAVKYVKEALAIEPQNGAYLDSLGWAFFKLNDLVNAEKYLLEAGEIVKNDPTVEEHLGDLYFKTGDLGKAQEFWMKSVKIGTEQDDIQKVRRKLEALQETLRKQKTGK
jgi:tetratricopeptide (TPR) repeat protein